MCSHRHVRKEWIISKRLFFPFSHQINKLEKWASIRKKNEVLAHSQQHHEVSKYNIFITKYIFSTISILFPTFFRFFFMLSLKIWRYDYEKTSANSKYAQANLRLSTLVSFLQVTNENSIDLSILQAMKWSC